MDIAIVGAGAASVCLLDALAQAAPGTHRLTIYERSDWLWRGRPYQPDSAAIRVNSPPEEMSIRANDVGHFARWLQRRIRPGIEGSEVDPWSQNQFVPRALYGAYLEDSAGNAIHRLRQLNWNVEIVRAKVTRAERSATRVILHSDTARPKPFDYAVLCVGSGRPADPYQLTGTAGFIPEPYPLTRNLANVDPNSHVAIVGSGLTAIDTVMALRENRHRGSVTMISRRGTLPAVRQTHVPYELKFFTPQRLRTMARQGREVPLEEWASLLRLELREAGQNPETVFREIEKLNTENPVDRLRRHLHGVSSEDLGMRILQRAVPDAGQDIWHVLSDRAREFIVGSHFRSVMSLCCPMPPTSAANLLEMIDSGQLQIRSGAQTVRPTEEGFHISTASADLHADTVISGVNAPPHRIPARSSCLVESLTRARLAEASPYGGLSIDRETSRLLVGGQPNTRLFGLGDIAFGSLFFTFGIPVLVARSLDIIQTMRDDGAMSSADPVALATSSRTS